MKTTRPNGPVIRELRKAKQCGLRELAREVGVNCSTISRLEAGTKSVSTQTLERIAARFGVEVSILQVQAGRSE